MKRILFLTLITINLTMILTAQDLSGSWSLNRCIDYARENNIQVQQARLGIQENEAYFKQAKAERLPGLSAQATQSFTSDKTLNPLSGNYENQDYHYGNYSLGTDVILFNGFRINNNISQKELSLQSSELAVQVTQNNIEIAVTQAYLAILYANESVKQAQQTLEGSEVQLEWAKNHYEAGSIAEADFAQIRSQYITDRYSLTVAENEFSRFVLQLKQLLELGIDQELKLDFPEVPDEQVQKAIPGKTEVYSQALQIMPEVKSGDLGIDIADLEYRKSGANFLPSLSMSASIGTGYNTISTDSYSLQLDHGLNEYIGLKLNIPIFSNRTNKTVKELARINIDQSRLNLENTRKDLLESVEQAYLDAVTSRSRFEAAGEQLNASELSYKLTEEQYSLGLKNTVDLITEKNKYLLAQQEYLQAKYSAILNYKLLDFYQGKEIQL
ncbi:MAG: TolC family protein [Bacteroidetes bacterium]|nr:TolC family protein [Bacteroidota bacterium]